MAKPLVTAMVRVKAKPGLEARLKEECITLLAPTRAEQGCLLYDLHKSPADPSVFFFYETWVSDESLDRHLQTPHVKRALEATAPLFAEPMEMTRWRKIA